MPGVWAGGRACAWPVCVWANVGSEPGAASTFCQSSQHLGGPQTCPRASPAGL